MPEKPFFVSVIIPVYNAAEYLPETIDNVLAQDYQSLEIILVDDGSTDNSLEVIKTFCDQAKIYSQEHKGPSFARNLGLSKAQGDVIAFIDADDLWPPGRLQIMLQRLMDDPQLDIILGRTKWIGDLSKIHGNVQFESPDKTAVIMSLGSALIRKSAFEATGNFDETLSGYEDLDWFMRAKEQGLAILIMKMVTQYYRMHESNYSHTLSSVENMMIVLRKSVNRRKGDPEKLDLPQFYDFDEPDNPKQKTNIG
jgi:glycosyltransferase involved in cell wall biosynthesis